MLHDPWAHVETCLGDQAHDHVDLLVVRGGRQLFVGQVQAVPVRLLDVFGETTETLEQELPWFRFRQGGGQDGVDQSEESDGLSLLPQLTSHFVGETPSEGPAEQVVGPFRLDVTDECEVVGRLLLHRAQLVDPLQAVHGLFGRQQSHQGQVDRGRAAGGVEGEQRGPFRTR